MKNNSKKSNKLSFEYIYNPYQLEKNVDFSSIFQRYLNDNNSIIDINGVTFYHALQIIHLNLILYYSPVLSNI